MFKPPFLKPGDLVIAIAPSGAIKNIDKLESGLKIWRDRGYEVKLGHNWNEREGYLGGSDRHRREALSMAWNNPECKAILGIRGGYGSIRLLEDWNWQKNSDRLKWIIGFSDITALLWSLANKNIASLHAPLLTTLSQEPKWSQERLFNYLEKGELKDLTGTGWNNGIGKGLLLPGNFTTATHLLGTPLQPSLKGKILAFEDVTEYPYRIDRMLTQWRLMGMFKDVKGIALGRFSRCEPYPGSKSWNIEEVLKDRLQDLDIPIVSDLCFGHDGVNPPLPVGHPVTLDSDRGKLIFD